MTVPAAHSMDTDWFSVDGAGEVAVLKSWEAGAVPRVHIEALGEQTNLRDALAVIGRQPAPPPELERQLARAGRVLAPDGAIDDELLHAFIHDPVAGAAAWSDLVRKHGEPGGNDEQMPASFLVRPGDGWTRVAVIAQGRAFSDQHVHLALVPRLAQDPRIEKVWLGMTLDSLFGLHAYRHSLRYENWISGPYERRASPTIPLTLAELPEELRPWFELAPLLANVFANDDRIQPIESYPCTSRQTAWVDSDERFIYPMPPDVRLRDAEHAEYARVPGLTISELPDPEPWRRFRKR